MTAPAGFSPEFLALGAAYREQLRAQDNLHTIRTVRATLLQVAGWLTDDDAGALLRVAAVLERDDWRTPGDLAAVACPMCEEIVCDTGCALAGVRAAVTNTSRLPVIVTTNPPDLDDPEIRRRLLLHGEVHIAVPAPASDPT